MRKIIKNESNEHQGKILKTIKNNVKRFVISIKNYRKNRLTVHPEKISKIIEEEVNMATIKSYIRGAAVNIMTGATLDPFLKKYRGGNILTTIPYGGRTLAAVMVRSEAPAIYMDGYEIPINSKTEWVQVDPIPSEDECDYCIVSSMYVNGCRAMGWDTSRLLTIDGVVIDEKGHNIGCVALSRN